ncbi:MAG: helix-turn-helix transcriptional regulator [Oscillibacter sp.]|nr:helix-turn-helix transcriptional regulator [Oscillibacter sp.]
MREQDAENGQVMKLTDADWEDQELVGEELRKRRETAGMTRADMAAKMGPGYSEELVSQYEAGSVPMQIGPFFAMLTALDITPDDVSPVHLRMELLAHNGYLKLNERSRNAVDQIIDAILSGQRQTAT